MPGLPPGWADCFLSGAVLNPAAAYPLGSYGTGARFLQPMPGTLTGHLRRPSRRVKPSSLSERPFRRMVSGAGLSTGFRRPSPPPCIKATSPGLPRGSAWRSRGRDSGFRFATSQPLHGLHSKPHTITTPSPLRDWNAAGPDWIPAAAIFAWAWFASSPAAPWPDPPDGGKRSRKRRQPTTPDVPRYLMVGRTSPRHVTLDRGLTPAAALPDFHRPRSARFAAPANQVRRCSPDLPPVMPGARRSRSARWSEGARRQAHTSRLSPGIHARGATPTSSSRPRVRPADRAASPSGAGVVVCNHTTPVSAGGFAGMRVTAPLR